MSNSPTSDVDRAIRYRKRLHQRRAHEVVAIEHDGQRYKIGIGREIVCIERGLLSPVFEVFLNAQKVNSTVDCLACDGAILISMLLQHGVVAAEIAKAMKRNPDGSPSSLFGHAADIINETRNQGDDHAAADSAERTSLRP